MEESLKEKYDAFKICLENINQENATASRLLSEMHALMPMLKELVDKMGVSHTYVEDLEKQNEMYRETLAKIIRFELLVIPKSRTTPDYKVFLEAVLSYANDALLGKK